MNALKLISRRFSKVASNLHPHIPPSCFVHPAAVLIGLVKLSENCSVWPTAVLRGDGNVISLGEGTNVQDGTIVHAVASKGPGDAGIPTKIGSRVSVGHSVTLHACTIEDHVLVGNGAIVLDGAIIRSYSIIAAGSVVAPFKEVTGGLWMGSPARFKRDLTADEEKWIRNNAAQYVDLKNHYMEGRDFPFVAIPAE